MQRTHYLGVALGVLVTVAVGDSMLAADSAQPTAIPTFHCLGLYWSPQGGSKDREVEVRYRAEGSRRWSQGLAMRYHPIAGTDEDLADYRGSIVDLSPDTVYEIRLSLGGTDTSAELKARTWSEAFPVGETVRVKGGRRPLEIGRSGKPGAYRVYDGQGAVIDVDHQHDQCITVDASYVILRNFVLRGAGKEPVSSRAKPIGAIEIRGGHHIVIEDCEITGWGRLNPATGFGNNCDSAIFSRHEELERLVVQRCRLHHPAQDGSTWYEPEFPTHTAGPQCISLFDTAGNHVIRYNECYSDLEHMYNDIIGGGSNGSFKGSPGPDSDIYGNLVSHCWDDGLEVEGGSRNVRVWNNYVTQSLNMIGNAACSIGPLYIWRNVVGRCQAKPDTPGYNFLKMGFAGGENWMTGTQYILHNTIFDEGGWLPSGGLGGNRIVKHTISRNNILHVRGDDNRSASAHENNEGNDFDYDLYNGSVPEGHERHGVRGKPVYQPAAGFDAQTRSGVFSLADRSAGVAAGEPIANFSGRDQGQAPDMGAHQRGEPPMRFGIQAAKP